MSGDRWPFGLTAIDGDNVRLIREILGALARRTGAFDETAVHWMAPLLLQGYDMRFTDAAIVARLREDPRCAEAIPGASKPEITRVLRAIVARPQRAVGNVQMKLLAEATGAELVLLRGKTPCAASEAFYWRRLPAAVHEPPFAGCDTLDCACRFSRAPAGPMPPRPLDR